MKRVLIILLIAAQAAGAFPKNPFATFAASLGLSGFAWYAYSLINPQYDMAKKAMLNKKVNTSINEPIHLHAYHTAINSDNNMYDYKLMKPTRNFFEKEMQEIGTAFIICTRFAGQKPTECSLERLHIDKRYRYQGLGGVLLDEAKADIQKRVDLNELNFVAHAEVGTNQGRLEQFYAKHGAVRKNNPTRKNEFVFYVRDNKV